MAGECRRMFGNSAVCVERRCRPIRCGHCQAGRARLTDCRGADQRMRRRAQARRQHHQQQQDQDGGFHGCEGYASVSGRGKALPRGKLGKICSGCQSASGPTPIPTAGSSSGRSRFPVERCDLFKGFVGAFGVAEQVQVGGADQAFIDQRVELNHPLPEFPADQHQR